MAEITNIRPVYDVSPVLAGFLGAGVLVVSVTVAVFLWTCCHRRYHQLTCSYKLQGDASADPPYRFIHMLKGISIYPKTISNSKNIVRVARRAAPRDREYGRPGLLLVDAGEGGVFNNTRLQIKPLRNGGQLQVEHELPVQADYCGNEYSGTNTTSPFTPDLGTLSLAVDYNFPKKALVVTIQALKGLPAVDEQSGSSDPYVKMTILPEKKHRVKTRVMRKSLDPVFDETFTFYGVAFSSLPELVLHFLVLSFDRFSRDDVIGETLVPLTGVDPSTGRVQLAQQICKRNIKCTSRGELLVSLSFQPVTHRLNVVVLKAKHLPKMDITGLACNPYVKVNIFYGRKRIAKKKTHVKKCTHNPVFNESFVYEVPSELLPDVSVEFLVIDFDRTTKNEVVGRLVLGSHSSSASASAHWREVCDSPRRQVAKWHTLSEY